MRYIELKVQAWAYQSLGLVSPYLIQPDIKLLEGQEFIEGIIEIAKKAVFW